MASLKLSECRVLVTGGAGLIGSHICDRLLHGGAAEVIVLDNFVRGRRENLAAAAASGRLTVIEGDIRDRGLLSRVMEGIDVVFHQAAIRITQCAEEPDLAMDVLVTGSYNVFTAAVAAGVKKVVAASSASVYGLADRFPTPEEQHPYNNRTLYGAAKAFNEGLLRALNEQHGLDYVALRYFNVYGPRMDTHGAYTEVFIRFMERMAANQTITIFGDGTQTMDFIYVDDVARANVLAACAPVTDRVYNVGSGIEVSLVELAHVVRRAMGSSVAIEHGPPRSVNAVPRRQADTWRASDELGFHPLMSLEAGVARLVEWWRATRARAEVTA
jgi:UDP-glucose 4-epimerase